MVSSALDVPLAQLGHSKEQNADDDVQCVEDRQGHHQLVEFELIFESRKQNDGRDVADQTEDADGHEENNLEDELHRFLVVHFLIFFRHVRDGGVGFVVVVFYEFFHLGCFVLLSFGGFAFEFIGLSVK